MKFSNAYPHSDSQSRTWWLAFPTNLTALIQDFVKYEKMTKAALNKEKSRTNSKKQFHWTVTKSLITFTFNKQALQKR